MAKTRFILNNIADNMFLKANRPHFTYMEMLNNGISDWNEGTINPAKFVYGNMIDGTPTTKGHYELWVSPLNNTEVDGKYWTLDTPENQYAIWYNPDPYTTPDPTPGGSRIPIEVKISNFAFGTEIGSNTRTALDVSGALIDTVDFYVTENLLPVENIQKMNKSEIMRTTTSGDGQFTEIRGTILGGTDISALVLGNHNLWENVTYRLRLYNTIDFDIEQLAYDSEEIAITGLQGFPSVIPWGILDYGGDPWGTQEVQIDEFEPTKNLVHWLPELEEGIYAMKIDIEDNNTGQPIYEIGRLILGEFIEPIYNISNGHTLQWKENTKQYRTEAGTLRSDITVPYKELSFNIGTINETDRVLLQHGFRKIGLRKDFFVAEFPDCDIEEKEIDYSGIMKITKVPKFTEFAQNYYRAKYIMEEV